MTDSWGPCAANGLSVIFVLVMGQCFWRWMAKHQHNSGYLFMERVNQLAMPVHILARLSFDW